LIVLSSIGAGTSLGASISGNGKRYSHIIDPRTGYPASGIISVSVFANQTELADALATGIFVLGVEVGLDLVNQLKGIGCIIVDVKGAKSIKAILGNLKAIAQGVAELRNLYGSGHGKSSSYKGLESRHASLAIGSSTTLVRFLWDSYERHHNNEVN
jgi:hypothetical protein